MMTLIGIPLHRSAELLLAHSDRRFISMARAWRPIR